MTQPDTKGNMSHPEKCGQMFVKGDRGPKCESQSSHFGLSKGPYQAFVQG